MDPPVVDAKMAERPWYRQKKKLALILVPLTLLTFVGTILIITVTKNNKKKNSKKSTENPRQKSEPESVIKTAKMDEAEEARMRTVGESIGKGIVMQVQASQKQDEDPNQLGGLFGKRDKNEGDLDKIITGCIIDPTKAKKITLDDIVGQEPAKQAIKESIIWPYKRKDLFTGIREPNKGILLFGPPGTGKTMLSKAIAFSLGAKFFNTSSSTFASKWFGESEKLMSLLFKRARSMQKAVIFFDEIDSIVPNRKDTGSDGTIKVTTEFMVNTEGLDTDRNDGRLLLIIAATNRPDNLDEAVLRRFPKRIRVDVPDFNARKAILSKCLGDIPHNINDSNWEALALRTDLYSASDLKIVCRAAAMFPIREVESRLESIKSEEVRNVRTDDFERALEGIRPSVSTENIEFLKDWESKHGAI